MKLDYWMYNIIKEALEVQINHESKRYNRKGLEVSKGNRWCRFGQMSLAKKKIQEIHEWHDQLIRSKFEEER